jgi:hypothetical protein
MLNSANMDKEPKPVNGQEAREREGLFTLADKEEMLQRLNAVDDNAHFQERFYPKLLRDAGTQKVPMGVIMMLTLAIHDYSKGMPPMIAGMVSMRVPEYIDALIPDPKLAAEAKTLWAQIEESSKEEKK